MVVNDDIGIQAQAVFKIKGTSTRWITVQQLRRICSKLKIPGYKNKSRAKTLALMGRHTYNRKRYTGMYSDGPQLNDSGSDEPTRKEPQCAFRLANVIFSDTFCSRFSQLATNRTRQELDGPVSIDHKFWIDVQEAFVDESIVDIGRLQFKHAAFDQMAIDPSIVVQHSWTKLRSIYADMKSRHKTAVANFTKSGTHGAEFWEFCSGQTHVLYLNMLVREKPGLLEVVTAMMSESSRIDSDIVELRGSSSSTLPCSSGSNTPRHAPKYQRVLDAMEEREELLMKIHDLMVHVRLF